MFCFWDTGEQTGPASLHQREVPGRDAADDACGRYS